MIECWFKGHVIDDEVTEQPTMCNRCRVWVRSISQAEEHAKGFMRAAVTWICLVLLGASLVAFILWVRAS